MTSEHNEGKPFDPKGPVPDFERVLSNLSNPELLSALDLALSELEKRLYRYAHLGPELLAMADEGLVLTVRDRARLDRHCPLRSTRRATCSWSGWGSGSPQAPAPPGTPTRG